MIQQVLIQDFKFSVELSNNISGLNSSLLTANVQDGFSDPVRNLQATMVTNVSVNLTWSSPSSTNGMIVGFSIQVNGVSVSTLLPFAELLIIVAFSPFVGNQLCRSIYWLLL